MASKPTDGVDVTKANFKSALENLETAVSTCDFVSIDCEMTGLFLETNTDSFLDDMPMRYYKMHASAKEFLVSQVGVSCFTLSDGVYTARTFNFNIFPKSFQGTDKRFTCQASSLEYLTQHKFDFNKFIYEGIPYLPISQKRKLLQEADRVKKYPRRDPPPSMLPVMEAVKLKVTQWHANNTSQTLTVADSATPKDRMFTYQALEELQLGDAGSPGFYVEKDDTSLVVTRATADELRNHEERQRQKRLDDVEEAVGFSHVMCVLQSASKPVIGHNMLFDLVYILNIFVGDIPTWQDFKKACVNWFPGGIYDTKHIVKALEKRWGQELFEKNSLGDLYVALQQGVQGGSNGASATGWRSMLESAKSRRTGESFALLPVEHARGFKRYSGASGAQYAHEAGFDAFMTGAVFAWATVLTRAADVTVPVASTKRKMGISSTTPEPSLAASPVLSPVPKRARLNDLVSTSLPQAVPEPLPPAVPGPEKGNGAGLLEHMAGMRCRVNYMKTMEPYCVVSMDPDPEVSRDHVLVLATKKLGSFPDRKDFYAAASSAAARVGPLAGFRTETLPSGPNWKAWAATVWGPPDPARYVREMMNHLSRSSVRKGCQLMTWAEFQSWKTELGLEADPYTPSRAPDSNDAPAADTDMLRWVLQSGCAIM